LFAGFLSSGSLTGFLISPKKGQSMIRMRCASRAAFVAWLMLLSRSEGQYVYWASDGAINRAPLEGGATQTIVSGLSEPHGVAIDPVQGKVYWAEFGISRLARANLDGSGVETFLERDTPSQLTLDPYDRRLFWSMSTPTNGLNYLDRVLTVKLDGTQEQELSAWATTTISSLAIHPSSFELFVALTGQQIWRTTNGALAPQRMSLHTGICVAIEQFHFQYYWDSGAWLFHSYVSGFPARPVGPSTSAPYMALDPVNELIYWSEPLTGRIQRAKLDGSGLETFKTGLGSPTGIAVLALLDCNGNAIDDICDVTCGTVGGRCDVPGCGAGVDSDRNGLLDICDDCNANGAVDACDFPCQSMANVCGVVPCDGAPHDCNYNGIDDSCEDLADCDGDKIPDVCGYADCNDNGLPDGCDLADGTSSDCNSNELPDECDLSGNDCNQNDIPDECDIAGGASGDCNGNDVPDECETDCNQNSTPDDCDLSGGTSLDCNSNEIPDECDVAIRDCNANSIPDDCDIIAGTSQDADVNGIPDECCPPPCPPPTPESEPKAIRKNRFLSFVLPQYPLAGPLDTAIRVELDSLYHPNPAPTAGTPPSLTPFEGQYRYLNVPAEAVARCCDPSSSPLACNINSSAICASDSDCSGLGVYSHCVASICRDSSPFNTYYRCAELGCAPEYRDWAALFEGGTVHVYGQVIAPSSVYRVAQIPLECQGSEPTCATASEELVVNTAVWGDVDESNRASAIDIGLVVSSVKCFPTCIPEPRTMLQPAAPLPATRSLTASDIGRVVDAVKGFHYPFSMTPCP
jgi:hypothetical protein